MIHIAICDDDREELTRMAALLGQYQSSRQAALSCDLFHSGMELLESLRHTAYDAMLLDILMPGLTGMETAREIRTLTRDPKIIFLTSSPEFAVESYAVEAFSYLLKPASADSLFPMLDKLFRTLQKQEALLTLNRPSGVIRLPFSTIVMVEVDNKHLRFHLEDGRDVEIPGALSEYESLLLSRREFIKVHRAFVVNMDFIQSLGARELITFDHKSVPVSRLLQSQVRAAYLDYLFDHREEET